jgi:uncharacterized protein YcnI
MSYLRFALLTLIALLWAAAQGSAHVTLEAREATVAAPFKAVFRVPHGCGESPTVKLRVQIPEGVIAVKPMPKPGWQIDVVRGPYAKTYSYFHGAKLSEGVKEVSWTGNLPDQYYDEFVLSGFISDGLQAGRKLYFPTVQECAEGVNRWIETTSGKDGHGQNPAPGLMLVPKK